jgi:large subunit ribosomal protein L4e
MRGGGGGRQGEAGGVASVRGGRQAHPPIVKKIIFKKLNKKENKLALCSAISATKSKEIIESRGHKIDKINVLFVVAKSEKLSKACKVIPGIDVKQVKDLSVLDLAPGGATIRLTVYSKSAIEEIAKIKSPHLELMVTIK